MPQEYVCLSVPDLSDPLSVVVTHPKDRIGYDATDSHLFLGYKPVVMALVFPPDGEAIAKAMGSEVVCLSFNFALFEANSTWRNMAADKNSLARLLLEKRKVSRMNNETVIFYEAIDGKHTFIAPGYQAMNNIIEKLRPRKPGNVGLPGSLYDMVRIAYSVPRVISLITIEREGAMNMFPTDLHGAVSDQFYINSLRIGGKANKQVETSRKLTIATLPSAEFKMTYSLGKNHMKDLQPIDSYYGQTTSRRNGVVLPASTNGYRELRQVESFDIGIHRIHTYETEYVERPSHADILGHIHQYYAQWRMDRGLETKMLLR